MTLCHCVYIYIYMYRRCAPLVHLLLHLSAPVDVAGGRPALSKTEQTPLLLPFFFSFPFPFPFPLVEDPLSSSRALLPSMAACFGVEMQERSRWERDSWGQHKQGHCKF